MRIFGETVTGAIELQPRPQRERTPGRVFEGGMEPAHDRVPYAEAGATWWMPECAPDAVSLDAVRTVLRDGPMAQ